MSAQAETMAAPTSTELRSPLYKGVVATGLVAFIAASAFFVVSVFNRTVAPTLLAIASALGSGLIMGLVSRLTLPRRGSLIRWLVALFGLCIGMTFLGWLSKGLLGMDLLGRSTPETDWRGLTLFLCSAVAAAGAISAWRRNSTSGRGSLSSGLGHAKIRQTVPKAEKRRRIQRAGRRRKGRVRLSAQVEHRCPFCLEIVEPRDPRGVMECPICHACHHADCWAVTGSCQVPHHSS